MLLFRENRYVLTMCSFRPCDVSKLTLQPHWFWAFVLAWNVKKRGWKIEFSNSKIWFECWSQWESLSCSHSFRYRSVVIHHSNLKFEKRPLYIPFECNSSFSHLFFRVLVVRFQSDKSCKNKMKSVKLGKMKGYKNILWIFWIQKEL